MPLGREEDTWVGLCELKAKAGVGRARHVIVCHGRDWTRPREGLTHCVDGLLQRLRLGKLNNLTCLGVSTIIEANSKVTISISKQGTTVRYIYFS